MKKIFLVTLVTLLFVSCKTNSQHSGSSSSPNIENSAKDITSFSINGSVGTINGTDISITIPYGTAKTELTPTITVSTGAKVSPESGTSQDFTVPVTYTVTADNKTTKDYTVNVAVASISSKEIVSFSALGVNGAITGTNISVMVPHGTDITSLTPAITHTGASVNPATGVAQNFTSPVTYTVTAADGTTKGYTVTVTVAAAGSKDITAFSISSINGSITGTSISVTMPHGTDITSLTPAITHTGASINPGVGVAQNFTNPISYIVTAEDNSTKVYTVTVTTVAAGGTYVLRDTGPAGGFIFYDKGSSSNGWRYMEATPSNQNISVWSNIDNAIAGTGDAIGTGQANTAVIVAQAGHTNSAAKLCDDLVLGGYSDWFLPSKEELNMMYINLKKGKDENGVNYTPVGGFAADVYWSSSEYHADEADYQDFNSAWRASNPKFYRCYVRCARAF